MIRAVVAQATEALNFSKVAAELGIVTFLLAIGLLIWAVKMFRFDLPRQASKEDREFELKQKQLETDSMRQQETKKFLDGLSHVTNELAHVTKSTHETVETTNKNIDNLTTTIVHLNKLHLEPEAGNKFRTDLIVKAAIIGLDILKSQDPSNAAEYAHMKQILHEQ